MSTGLKKLLPVAPLAGALVFALLSAPRPATAGPDDPSERNERCATRIFTTMIGEGASTEALASANPQSFFDTLVKDPKFYDRFSRFINAQYNRSAGANPSEDSAYYLSKYVLENDKPWTEMFLGKYDVVPSEDGNNGSEGKVIESAMGLGYFRSRAWMLRYAGNESEGVRIAAAYRMMQNTIGLQLAATTNAPEADVSAKGRQSAQCAGCHFSPWFALDHVAAVLGKKTGNGNNTQFSNPEGARQILGGVTIGNDQQLVEALVANEAFDVNACRLAFKFLYNRTETSCEGPLFDTCVTAFKTDKKISSALAVIAKDGTFCE